jgi:uncharacterized membrane protein
MNAAELTRLMRRGDAVALAVILCLFGLSVAVYDTLPAEMVVHYTPPGGVYYGPETLPKAVALVVVPLIAGVTYVALRLPLLLLERWPVPDAIGPIYRAGIVAMLLLFGAVHVALILLNSA